MMKVDRFRDIPILMYHQFVEDKKDGGKIKLFVTKKTFEMHLRILKILGYETITFKDLDRIGLENRREKKYIIITVDDGYKDNYKILYPLLKKYNMKAVIYFVTGSDYNSWTVESDGEKKFHLMDKKEVLELHESGLIEFGGHTLSHPSMVTLNDDELEKEIVQNKKDIESIIGEEIISFAYPYGHNSKRVQKAVKKAGYKYSVSTDSGTGIIDENLFDIRRTAIDKTSLLDFIRKISRKYLPYKYKKRGDKKFKDQYE
ncbi:MAG: polysaccharide deacetylase family protein [Cetobacterium sp.]